MTDNEIRTARRAYYAAVTGMDEQLGRVMDALEEAGVANNTIVIFHSDHGWHLGEHAGNVAGNSIIVVLLSECHIIHHLTQLLVSRLYFRWWTTQLLASVLHVYEPRVASPSTESNSFL